jgi:hypothetical protein
LEPLPDIPTMTATQYKNLTFRLSLGHTLTN